MPSPSFSMIRMLSVARLACAAALLSLPALAASNGGSSGWEEQTEGALLPGQGGRFGTMKIVPEQDVECVSENLSLTLERKRVTVAVDYVFLNHGKEKRLEYGFPFAFGEETILEKGKVTDRRRLGEPSNYLLSVDGSPVAAQERPGGEVPKEIPVPEIKNRKKPASFVDDEPDSKEARSAPEAPTVTRGDYRWTYFVSPITFPAQKPVAVRVNYSAPYLVYSRTTELGTGRSPGSFSYLLSTGGKWRGGTIGKLRVQVRVEGMPLSQVALEGLPFAPGEGGATFEAKDFRPSTKRDIFVQLSEFARIGLAPAAENGGVPAKILGDPADPVPEKNGWISPPISPQTPFRIALTPSNTAEVDRTEVRGRQGPSEKRYRIGLAPAGGGRSFARLKTARVELSFATGEEQAFQASFQDVPDEAVKANRGWRFIFFDATDPPKEIRLKLSDVYPGDQGEKRLRLSGIVLEKDVSNYEGYMPEAR